MAIDSVAKLRAVYRPPRARSGLKVLDHLDVHCRNFLALSPLCVISSSRADGRADASPRGDLPGSLAHVLDDRTLLLPDPACPVAYRYSHAGAGVTAKRSQGARSDDHG